MISNFKIAMMVVALVLVVLIPILTFVRFRKNPKITQGILWGILAYVAFVAIRTILMLIINMVIFPSPVEGEISPLLQNNDLLSGLLNAFVVGVAFVGAGALAYKFQLKKIDDEDLPLMNSMVFNLMSSMTLITQLIQYIMLSFNFNAGNLDKYVNEDVTIVMVEELAGAIQSLSAISFFELGFSRWLDIVIFGIGFALLYKFMKKRPASSVVKYLGLTFLVVFGYIAIGTLSVSFLQTQVFLDLLIKIAYVALVFVLYRRYENSYAN